MYNAHIARLMPHTHYLHVFVHATPIHSTPQPHVCTAHTLQGYRLCWTRDYTGVRKALAFWNSCVLTCSSWTVRNSKGLAALPGVREILGVNRPLSGFTCVPLSRAAKMTSAQCSHKTLSLPLLGYHIIAILHAFYPGSRHTEIKSTTCSPRPVFTHRPGAVSNVLQANEWTLLGSFVIM